MIIEVDRIPSPEGLRCQGEEPASILGMESDPFFRLSKPVRYNFLVTRVADRVLVQGTIELDFEAACSRCSAFFTTSARDKSFLRDYEVTSDVKVIDMTDDIREGVLLSLPTFLLCSQECKGLCSICGKNLNEGACKCQRSTTTEKWSVLDQLQLKK